MNKTRLLLTAAVLAAAAFLAINSASAATLTAEWDYPASEVQFVDTFKVYELSGTTATPVATSTKTATAPAALTAQIPNVNPGVHTYFVTAANSYWGESARSNNASTPPAALAPGQFRVKVTTTVIGRAAIKQTKIEIVAVNEAKPGNGAWWK